MDKVKFLMVEDVDPDLVLSFAIDDNTLGIKSLILMRAPRFEPLLSHDEWGVKVSMEGDEDYENNLLEKFKVEGNVIEIIALRKTYKIDISKVGEGDLEEMKIIIGKLNFDSSFEVVFVNLCQ